MKHDAPLSPPPKSLIPFLLLRPVPYSPSATPPRRWRTRTRSFVRARARRWPRTRPFSRTRCSLRCSRPCTTSPSRPRGTCAPRCASPLPPRDSPDAAPPPLQLRPNPEPRPPCARLSRALWAQVLPFLQVILFRHQFALRPADMQRERALMLALLRDPQARARPRVRQSARGPARRGAKLQAASERAAGPPRNSRRARLGARWRCARRRRPRSPS